MLLRATPFKNVSILETIKWGSDLQNWKRPNSMSSLLTCWKAGQWAVERCSLNARMAGDLKFPLDSTAFHPKDIKPRTCMVRSPVIGTLGRTSRERPKIKCSKLSDCCNFALGRKIFPSSHRRFSRLNSKRSIDDNDNNDNNDNNYNW